MQFGRRIGGDINVIAAGLRPAPDQVIDFGLIHRQARGASLVDHPGQREFGETAFGLRVAAADIAVHAREPDLANILVDGGRGIEWIAAEFLRVDPAVEPEQPASLADRDRLPECTDAVVGPREPQRLHVEPEMVLPGYDHRGHRVPDPDEFDADRAAAGDLAEMPGLLQL